MDKTHTRDDSAGRSVKVYPTFSQRIALDIFMAVPEGKVCNATEKRGTLKSLATDVDSDGTPLRRL